MKSIIRAILGLYPYPQVEDVSEIKIIEPRMGSPILFGGLSERSNNIQIIRTKTNLSAFGGQQIGCSNKEAEEIFRNLKEEYGIEPIGMKMNEAGLGKSEISCRCDKVLHQIKSLSRFASKRPNSLPLGKRRFFLKQKKS